MNVDSCELLWSAHQATVLVSPALVACSRVPPESRKVCTSPLILLVSLEGVLSKEGSCLIVKLNPLPNSWRSVLLFRPLQGKKTQPLTTKPSWGWLTSKDICHWLKTFLIVSLLVGSFFLASSWSQQDPTWHLLNWTQQPSTDSVGSTCQI